MNFMPGMLGDDFVHEIEEPAPPATLVIPCLRQSSGHFHNRKQGGGAKPPVVVREAGHRLIFGNRGQPCARSSTWIDGFSPIQITTACSGEVKYRPTTPAALAAHSGSVLMHQLWRRSSKMRCRRSPRQLWSAEPHAFGHARNYSRAQRRPLLGSGTAQPRFQLRALRGIQGSRRRLTADTVRVLSIHATRC